MKDVYSLIDEEKQIKIDFKSRILKVDGKEIITNGILSDGYYLEPITDQSDHVFRVIEDLYQHYRFSLPTRGCKDSRYFKAKEFDEIPDKWLFFTQNTRLRAKSLLELYVLNAAICNKLNFPGWFWQSKRYPELVVLKEWAYAN